MASHYQEKQYTCIEPACRRSYATQPLLLQHRQTHGQPNGGRKKRSLSTSSGDSGRSASLRSVQGIAPGSRGKQPKRQVAPGAFQLSEESWSSSFGGDRSKVTVKARPNSGHLTDELMELTRYPGWQDGWDSVEGRSLVGGVRKVVQLQGAEMRKEWFTILTPEF